MRIVLDRSGGIILNILGQVMQNLAAVLMSFGQQGPSSRMHRGAWYTGVVLIVIGALAVFASYGVAEQSLLGSLISVQFVSNMFFCRVILGKHITVSMFFGTAIVVGGTLLCIMTAPHVEHEIDEDDMERLYLRNPVFQRFLLGEAMIWILMDKLYSTYVDAHETGQRRWGQEVMLPCMFVARAALPGSFSVVAAKNLAVLLRITTEGRNMLGNALLWFNLIFWLGGTAYWMRRMNHALAKFNGAFIIPLCQVNWSCATIVTGGIFFEEFKHFSWNSALLFVLGVGMNFSGVIMLHQKKRSNKVKDPNSGKREGAADEEFPCPPLTHTPSLELPYPAPYVRRNGSWHSRTPATSSADMGAVLSNNSSHGSSREVKRMLSLNPLINPVGLIPLMLDGVQEERTESGGSNHTSERERMDVMERLAMLEEANRAQHMEVLGKIAELVSALNLPKGVKPIPTTSSETGTPVASGSSTPMQVPPEAPLQPSTPPPSITPLHSSPADGTDSCSAGTMPSIQALVQSSTTPRVTVPSSPPLTARESAQESARRSAPTGEALPPLRRLSLSCGGVSGPTVELSRSLPSPLPPPLALPLAPPVTSAPSSPKGLRLTGLEATSAELRQPWAPTVPTGGPPHLLHTSSKLEGESRLLPVTVGKSGTAGGEAAPHVPEPMQLPLLTLGRPVCGPMADTGGFKARSLPPLTMARELKEARMPGA